MPKKHFNLQKKRKTIINSLYFSQLELMFAFLLVNTEDFHDAIQPVSLKFTSFVKV